MIHNGDIGSVKPNAVTAQVDQTSTRKEACFSNLELGILFISVGPILTITTLRVNLF